MSLVPVVLDFWFSEAGPTQWFNPSTEFDDIVLRRFFKMQEQAADGQFREWETFPQGSLALCLLLDQFPRNMFRGTPRAFATDAEARRVANSAIARNFDTVVGMTDDYRLFFYLPFSHSESMADQNRSCELMAALASNPDYARYAEKHRDVIQRFGRFPHRNEAMGRRSTPEELAFLESDEGHAFAGGH